MEFKDKLRELLEAQQMKPADLARKTDISEAVISNYLSGKREPMGKMCAKIASALHITVDELLDTGFEAPKKEAPATITIAEAWVVILREVIGHEPTKSEIDRAMGILELTFQQAREDR